MELAIRANISFIVSDVLKNIFHRWRKSVSLLGRWGSAFHFSPLPISESLGHVRSILGDV